jgi:hypothetical protein
LSACDLGLLSGQRIWFLVSVFCSEQPSLVCCGFVLSVLFLVIFLLSACDLGLFSGRRIWFPSVVFCSEQLPLVCFGFVLSVLFVVTGFKV